MKTAEPRSSSAASNQKAAASFFGKNGGSFFNSESTNEINSFFNNPQFSYRLVNGDNVQTKLTIGPPNDKYEQEADHIADKVVQRLSQNGCFSEGSSKNTIQTKPENNISRLPSSPIQMKCAECEKEEKLHKKEEEGTDMPKEKIQKKPIFESNVEPLDDDSHIQRKCTACEKEEKVQKKEDGGNGGLTEKIQRKSIFESEEPSSAGGFAQRKCEACAHEEKLQKREDHPQVESYLPNSIHLKSLAEGKMGACDHSVLQRKCEHCEQEEKAQKKIEETEVRDNNSIHLKSFDYPSGNIAHPSVEAGILSSKGSGSTLPESIRASMESSFDTDFGNVRIHNDSRSTQMNRDLHAQAFTHGNDIYFNSGKYDISSTSGKHLLAHELTHTVQQGASPYVAAKTIQRICDHSECAKVDRQTPSCPNPSEYLLDQTLHDIRYSILNSTQHPEVLARGTTDPGVSLIRKLLLNIYCDDNGFDRTALENESELVFGNEMKKAVMYFQLNHKDTNGDPLTVDGDIGPATLGAMDLEMGLTPVAIPKKAEGKGHCFGEAKQGPGMFHALAPNSPNYLHFQPFFPAVKAWEISNFDIAKFFLKTEHRDFLRSSVVPDIKDTVAKTKSKLKVRVIGEASTTWTNEFNMRLSRDRANCMVSSLKEFGLDSGLIESPATALGEELTSVLPIIKGKSLFPIDNTEDLTARKVTLVLFTDKADDCSDEARTRVGVNFVAYIACHTPNSYLINIMNINEPKISGLEDAPLIYREFKWIGLPPTSGCMFIPTFLPSEMQIVPGFRGLKLATQDPDNPFAPSDFIGLASHFTRKSGESTIQKSKSLAAASFLIPLPGVWHPSDCAAKNEEVEGALFPLGPVKCGQVPKPQASDNCKPKEECPPETRQRPAKKFVATMKRLAVNPLSILRRIPRIKDVMKKIDDFFDLFGKKIDAAGTYAYVHIGTADDEKNPIQKSFHFGGGEITTSSRSILSGNITYAEEFTLADTKQLEKMGGGSDFSAQTDLIIKGGTNHEELHISGISKPIIFKGLPCLSGGDQKSTGYLKSFSDAECELLDTHKLPDRECKDEKEDCSDDQKAKGDDKFLIKIGRATVADLPIAGKKLADKLGCGVTAAFINIGTMTGDDKEKIYRKFILIAKNDCRYTVQRSNQQKDFTLSRVLTYPDPNDIESLSDFIGAAFLNASSDLKIVAPKNLWFNIKLPGTFDGGCKDPSATGVVIPISAVDCGPVPDPIHSTTPDITDLDRCEDFKKKNLPLVNGGIADLKFRWPKLTDRITNPPQLIYPLYNNLFYYVGKTIPHAIFFGKAADGQKVITVADMYVVSALADVSNQLVFDVRFVSEPCSFNESGQPVFVLPKDCKEAIINVIEIFPIYPLPDDDTDIDQRPPASDDNSNPPPDEKMNEKCPSGDCHSAGIVTVPFGPAKRSPLLDLANPSRIQRKCAACEQKEKESIQPKFIAGGADNNIQRCAACEEKEKQQQEKKVRRKPAFESSNEDIHLCPACEHDKKLEKKSALGPDPQTHDIEANLSSSKGSGHPLEDNVRSKMESSFNADFSNVRIHDDSGSAQMNRDLHAKAFTHGSDIYFSSGKFDTTSNSGEHLLAHELTHTIQQGKYLNSATATGNQDNYSEDQGKSKGLADTRFTIQKYPDVISNLTALEYAEKYSSGIAISLNLLMSRIELGTYSPYASWSRKMQKFGEVAWKLPEINVIRALRPLLQPIDVENLINRGRDLKRDVDDKGNVHTATVGRDAWYEDVVTELKNALTIQLAKSLVRVMPRYIASCCQTKMAFPDISNNANLPQPFPDDIIAAHPMDTLIISALCQGRMVDIDYDRIAREKPVFPDQYPGYKRDVKIEFQVAKGAWFWLLAKTKDNANPLVEEVANKLYGDSTQAWRLIDASPLFGFSEVNAMLPEFKEELKKKSFDPNIPQSTLYSNIKELSGTGAVSGNSDPVAELTNNPLRDEVALNQAGKLKTSAKIADTGIVENMRLSFEVLDAMILNAKRFNKEKQIIEARDLIKAKREKLLVAKEEEVKQWATQSVEQKRILSGASMGLAEAVVQLEHLLESSKVKEANKLADYAADPLNNIADKYIKAAASSFFPGTGDLALSEANELSRMFNIELMEGILRTVSHSIEESATDKTGKKQGGNEAEFGIAKLQVRERDLRQRLSQERENILRDPEQIKSSLEAIYKELADLQAEAGIVANLDAIDSAQKALWDSQDWISDIIVQEAELRGNHLDEVERWRSQWETVYASWKSGDHIKAKKLFADLINNPDYKSMFERTAGYIKDAATWALVSHLLVIIAITAITWGVGTYFTALGATAWGGAAAASGELTAGAATAGLVAGTVAEAATFTTLNALLLEPNTTWKGYLGEFAWNLALFGILRKLSMLYRGAAAIKAATTAGKTLLVTSGEMGIQWATLNIATIAKAEIEKRLTKQKNLTGEEIGIILLKSTAMFIGMTVMSRFAEPFMQELAAIGSTTGARIRLINSQRQRLAVFAKEITLNGDIVKARALILQDRSELDAEMEFYKHLLENPDILVKAGYTESQIKSLRDTGHQQIIEIDISVAMSKAKQIGANEYSIPQDLLPEILSAYRKAGAFVWLLRTDENTTSEIWAVQPKKGPQLRIITEAPELIDIQLSKLRKGLTNEAQLEFDYNVEKLGKEAALRKFNGIIKGKQGLENSLLKQAKVRAEKISPEDAIAIAQKKLLESGFFESPLVKDAIESQNKSELRGKIAEYIARAEAKTKFRQEDGFEVLADIDVVQQFGNYKTVAEAEAANPGKDLPIYYLNGKVWRRLTDIDLLVLKKESGIKSDVVEMEEIKASNVTAAKAREQQQIAKDAMQKIACGDTTIQLHLNRKVDITGRIEFSTASKAVSKTRGVEGRKAFDRSIGLTDVQLDTLIKLLIGGT